jgi:hypothetical protein
MYVVIIQPRLYYNVIALYFPSVFESSLHYYVAMDVLSLILVLNDIFYFYYILLCFYCVICIINMLWLVVHT